ncbi:MAG TPA: AAA family ATPase [Acidobacteriaceae bacterium]|nr:AAA family ATPase [Acidobacteriaceae bacterium]
MDTHRRIVLISGPPASGKTTIARPLAEALGFALLTKDDIKESLFTSMSGPPGDVDFSRRIGDAAMHLLWALAPQCPQVALEANFRTQSAFERDRVAALIALPGARLVEVFCRVPLEEAARRFAERARLERHHPAHALSAMSVEQLATYGNPFALSPVIEVDTSRPVDLDALVARVRTALEAEPPCGG